MMRVSAFHELDEVFSLTKSDGEDLLDWRTKSDTQHTMTAMLRQSLFGKHYGYKDTNDDGNCLSILRCGRWQEVG